MDEIINWLQGYLALPDGLCVDNMAHKPGACGLYNLGIELAESKSDILGRTRQRLRWTFQLRRLTARHNDNASHALWMQEFQLWVLNQSQNRQAPQLGENTQWVTKNGKLTNSDRPDTCLYTVDLVVEFDI